MYVWWRSATGTRPGRPIIPPIPAGRISAGPLRRGSIILPVGQGALSMSSPRRKRFYPYFFGIKFYMVTGSHWGYLPCGSRLWFMVLMGRPTRLSHRSRIRCARFLIGSLHFTAACKSDRIMVLPAIYNRLRQGVTFPFLLSWTFLDSLEKSGADWHTFYWPNGNHNHANAVWGLYKSPLFPVRDWPVLKNATPERFEFRFNPLNRNVLV